MTEVSEGSVPFGPLLLGGVLRWSSWPLLPGTRPLTRHQKPHFPRGRPPFRFLHPGSLPLGWGTLLTVFVTKEQHLVKLEAEEPP